MITFSSKKPKLYFTFLLLKLLILLGCTSGYESGDVTVDALTTELTVTRFVEPTKIATLTPSILTTPTNAIASSPTSTPTSLTSTLTPIPITPTLPAHTYTPVATLSVEQEGALLSRLLANIGGCELPCWWGITPGLTNAGEARDLFASQGVDDWVLSFDGTYALMGLGYPRVDSSIYTSDVIVQFGIKNNLIQYISVDGGYRQEELRPTFIQDWQQYSPASMLDRYGSPSFVETAIVENSPYYRLIFSYPHLGTEITYIAPFEALANNKRKICFDLEHIDYIAVGLYPPDQETELPFKIIPDRLDSHISWEATTGLDMEAFQQVFQNTSTSPCIELDLN